MSERVFYSQDQFEEVVSYLPTMAEPPGWLILGGPADANEAQTAKRMFPDLKIVACEPNVAAIEWQVRHGWPEGALLLPFLLGEKAGEMVTFHCPPSTSSLRHGSAHPGVIKGKRGGNIRVESVTLDWLEERYGPFERAILWLDVEGWEPQVLRGGEKLLASGRVKLANVECQTTMPAESKAVHDILTGHGYRHVHSWKRDRIYVR